MRIVLGLMVVLLFAGLGGGAGVFLRPSGEQPTEVAPPEPLPEPQFVSFPREFIVPLVTDGRVRAHVVLTLGLHSDTIPREGLLGHEPLLRDRLLEALFRHATMGGFDDSFTDAMQMNRLRTALNEAASAALHPDDVSILVTSIDRRDR